MLFALVFDFSPDVSNIFENRSKWQSDVPEKPSEHQNTRTSVFPLRNSCLSKVTVAGFHPEEVQKSHFAAPLVLAKQHLLPNGSHFRAQKCPS